MKIRFKHGMDLMFQDTREWSMMCCKKAIGGCDACTGNTLAYVMESKRSFGSDHSTNVRFCALSFTQKDKKWSLGMTLFHEMMHMASSVADHGYSKVECLDNAVRRPEYARHNSAAYVYFAAEAGMIRKNYLKLTGGAAMSPKCFDKYSNCPTIARACCHKKSFGPGGETYAKGCCASCTWVDNSTKCGGTRKENPERAADHALIKEAKVSAARRRVSNDARRCKEDKGGSTCNPAALKRIRKDKEALKAKRAAVKKALKIANAKREKLRIAKAKAAAEFNVANRKAGKAAQAAARKESPNGLTDKSKDCA